jgi:hypothetical protein
MTAELTVVSGSGVVLKLVGDYAHGLGCASEAVSTAEGTGLRIDIGTFDARLVDILTHVALACAKAGLDVDEPRCELTYRGANANSRVRLALRIARFDIEGVGAGAIQ